MILCNLVWSMDQVPQNYTKRMILHFTLPMKERRWISVQKSGSLIYKWVGNMEYFEQDAGGSTCSQTTASDRVGNSRPWSAPMLCRSSAEYNGRNQSNFLVPKTCSKFFLHPRSYFHETEFLRSWTWNKFDQTHIGMTSKEYDMLLFNWDLGQILKKVKPKARVLLYHWTGDKIK